VHHLLKVQQSYSKRSFPATLLDEMLGRLANHSFFCYLEWREEAYDSAKLYKERTNRWHDKRIKTKQFKSGGKVLLFNSHIRSFGHDKLRSKWKGPYLVLHVADHGTVTLQCDEGHSTLMANALNYSLSQTPRILWKWMSSIFLS
jgi:hypothetical protein